MKKAITIIILCLVFIIIYFMQLNFFSHFTIWNVMPNLFIIFILFIGLYAGIKMGTAFGVIYGIMIDFLGNSVIRRVSNSIGGNWIFTEDI